MCYAYGVDCFSVWGCFTCHIVGTDGKQLLYVNTSYSMRVEILFIKTRADKNYVLSFDNPDYKQWIIDDMLKLNKDIEIVKEF